MFAVINVFPKEKIIVYRYFVWCRGALILIIIRERSARAYETMSYFLAKFFVEVGFFDKIQTARLTVF